MILHDKVIARVHCLLVGCSEGPRQCKRHITGVKIGREKGKLPSFEDGAVLYSEKPKESADY